jgi:hypothetical protein
VTLSAPDTQARELQEFISKWQGEQKIAGMDALMSQYLSRLRDAAQQETWLFRVAALCRLRRRSIIFQNRALVARPSCSRSCPTIPTSNATGLPFLVITRRSR